MSLLMMEGFDWLDTSLSAVNLETLLDGKYSNSNMTTGGNNTIVTGRGTGNALTWAGSAASQFIRDIARQAIDGNATFILGMAVKTPPIFDSGETFLSIRAGSTEQVTFEITGSGVIQAFRGTSSLLGSATALVTNTWYYLEFKVLIDNSVGTVDIRANESSILSLSGIDTRQSLTADTWDHFLMRGSAFGDDAVTDDIYLCNGAGATNNDFLGDVRVEVIVPTGDGDDEDWTTSSGTSSFALVDELPLTTVPADTDYVESSTTAQLDLFTYGNLVELAGATTIHGVQVNSIAKVTGEQFVGLLNKTKTSTTEGTSSELQVGSDDYRTWSSVFETDPTTSVAWTESGINGAQFGIEIGTVN